MAEVMGDNNQDTGSEDGQSKQKRSAVGLDEVTSDNGQYLSFKVGDEVRMQVERIEKVEGGEYTLSSVDHKYELIDADGDRLSVTAWGMWRMIQEAYRQAQNNGLNGVSGLHLHLNHVGRENWVVGWSLDGDEWNQVDPDGG